MIPFIDLAAQQQRIRDKVDTGITKVLDHGAYVMGPEVGAIERRLADFAGTKHCVSCSSGTDALVLALIALGLKPGQGVIVPSFTFAASAEVMPLLGAVPVFADVDETSFNIDPGRLDDAMEAARQAGVEVAGIIGVGLFGQPADFEAINAFAKSRGLWVVDDAAQSFGASWNARSSGGLGDVTCTSFFPAKPLGCYGDGGAVFTDDDDRAEIMRSCRVHGMGKTRYINERIGMTARLDTIQAAVLDAKMDIFEDEMAARQEVAERYATLLNGTVETPSLSQKATSSWAQYTVKLPSGCRRETVIETLRDDEIPSAIYYPVPMHRQPPYKDFPQSAGGLGVCDALCDRVLALPMHPYLDGQTQGRIARALEAGVRAGAG